MDYIIHWFFQRIVEVLQFVLNFKVYGELSILHFIIGFNFLIILFSFYKFGINQAIPENISLGVRNFRNKENKRERIEYYKQKEADKDYYLNKSKHTYHAKHSRSDKI